MGAQVPDRTPDLATLGLRVLGDDPRDVAEAAAVLGTLDGGFTLLWTALMYRPANSRALITPLGKAPVDKLVAAAAQSLAAAPPAARVAIVHVLSGVHDTRASELISAALEDVEIEVRVAALRSLAERGQAVPRAVVRCRADASVEVRTAAVDVLASVRTGEAVDHLIHYAADPAPEVRTAARVALGDRRTEEVARSAMRALRDPLMRRAAVSILGDLGAAGAPLIVHELADAPQEVRGDLEEALRIGGGIDRSRQDMRHPAAKVRLEAVRLLRLLEATDATESLIEALNDPSPAVRKEVIETLTVVDRSGASTARLKEVFLGDPDLDVVSAAEEALRVSDEEGQDPQR